MKTVTFTCMHFTVAFTVAWIITGDLLVGGLVAIVEPLVNSIAYVFHEKLWRRHDRQKVYDLRQQNAMTDEPSASRHCLQC